MLAAGLVAQPTHWPRPRTSEGEDKSGAPARGNTAGHDADVGERGTIEALGYMRTPGVIHAACCRDLFTGFHTNARTA